ncbi:hypothetical protein ACFS70_14495 [Chitinophaga cymbidii]
MRCAACRTTVQARAGSIRRQ